MTRRRLCFIHSSDWHLERPVGGLADVPDRLKSVFLEAPYVAAERVVSTALSEQADFLLLAGDIIDVELAGPRGVSFLQRQFERLAERQIQVYWAGGKVDRPETWPVALHLPGNVFRFSSRRPENVVYELGGIPRARITGLCRPRGGKIRAADFLPDADGLPTIAVAHGRVDRASLAARRVAYWALGGKHHRSEVLDSPHAAQYSGSPQSRSGQEAGSFGCTIVEIDDDAAVHTRPVATDLVRWHSRRATVGDTTSVDVLESLLIEQLNELRRASPDVHSIVSWTVNGKGPLLSAIRQGRHVPEMLSRLRRRFELEQPILWLSGIEVEPESAVPPSWLEQDSLLGDYLRLLTHFGRQDESEPADLIEPLRALADRFHPSGGAEALTRLSDEARRRVLQKAAVLGTNLLVGEEVRP